MKGQIVLLLVTVSILVMSCSSDTSGPINAITDIESFSHAEAKSKFGKVESIQKELLYGEWTMISSYFTNQSTESVSTFGLEGRKYSINKDGTVKIDNSALGFGESTGKWKLTSDNTVFHDGLESWHVRVNDEIMEWIEKIDEDYSYFVLIK